MSEVCANIDSRDDQIKFLFEISEHCQRNRIRWRTIASKCLCAIFEVEFTNTQGAIQCFHMSAARPVSVRREDGYFTEITHFLRESQKPGSEYAVIVCY